MHAGLDGFRMPSVERVEEVTGRMRLLSDPTRLRILCAIAHDESDVGCLAEVAMAAVPTVSQHLAKLRLAGIVRPRRNGQHVIYELVDPAVRDLLNPLLNDAPAPLKTCRYPRNP